MNKEAFEHNDGDVDMRSMHPLWEEYALPNQPLGEYSFFYFSPYNGELSLSFPESNSQERGGILADGKCGMDNILGYGTDHIAYT